MIFQKKENSRKTQHLEKVDAIVEQGAIACVLFLLERFFAIFQTNEQIRNEFRNPGAYSAPDEDYSAWIWANSYWNCVAKV